MTQDRRFGDLTEREIPDERPAVNSPLTKRVSAEAMHVGVVQFET